MIANEYPIERLLGESLTPRRFFLTRTNTDEEETKQSLECIGTIL